METHYSSERNVQILISLMKEHGIKKVIASPGTTNIAFVGSIQSDPYFEIYSSVDERSAAYIACGLAAETGEAVALSCTGATASREYISGLTEAYYRKLPILAVTSTQHPGRIGSYMPQVIDRTQQMNDMAVCSVQALLPSTKEDEKVLNADLNRAILALKTNGGGPVHINLMTAYNKEFKLKILPGTRVIRYFEHGRESANALPEITGNTAVVIGEHNKWCVEEQTLMERFCEKYNGVVLAENDANYKGKYRITPSLLCSQENYISDCFNVDTLVCLGKSVTDIQHSIAFRKLTPKQIFWVNEEGSLAGLSYRTTCVFKMSEADFFRSYCADDDTDVQKESSVSYYGKWKAECDHLEDIISDMPFSSVWIALRIGKSLPEHSVLHYPRKLTWSMCNIPDTVYTHSGMGGVFRCNDASG